MAISEQTKIVPDPVLELSVKVPNLGLVVKTFSKCLLEVGSLHRRFHVTVIVTFICMILCYHGM
jgi:hypothetical protein